MTGRDAGSRICTEDLDEKALRDAVETCRSLASDLALALDPSTAWIRIRPPPRQ